MSEKETARRLVDWFLENARDLPWRGAERDPYHVLISELMLQQTQVDRVVPKFQEFKARFPTMTDLAQASEEEVLEVWSGLGYYRRARFLHRAAQIVARDNAGKLPRDVTALEALPGIGTYTAAAVASLAFGLAAPVLDGNVMRVAARVLARAGSPRTAAESTIFKGWVTSLIENHDGSAGEINEALMELGAMICAPRRPSCSRCPIMRDCRAAALGQPEAYPAPLRAQSQRAVEKISWLAACCVDSSGSWLLTKIESGPVLRRLWLPPIDQSGAGGTLIRRARALVPDLSLRSGKKQRARVLGKVKHSITYRRITVVPVLIEVEQLDLPQGHWMWADPQAPGKPTSSLLGKLAAHVAQDSG